MTATAVLNLNETPLRSVHLGPRLRELRTRLGYKQSDLARKLGLDAAQPSRWECPWSTRYQPVPGKHLPRLADILEVSLAELAPEALNLPAASVPPMVVRVAPPLPIPNVNAPSKVLNLLHMPPPDPPDEQLPPRKRDAVVFTTGGDLTAPLQRQAAKIRCWSCSVVTIGPANEPPHTCAGCGARIRAITTIRVVGERRLDREVD